MRPTSRFTRVRAAAAFVVLVTVGVSAGAGGAGADTTSSPSSSVGSPADTGGKDRLVAPRTTPIQDTRYLADVAKADTDLADYVQQQGNVALRAMLTDGTAFCAFLRRGGGIDNALLDLVVGARGVEPQTHLPAKVATFNTMEAVALIDLCPSEQKLVPALVRERVGRLGRALDAPSG